MVGTTRGEGPGCLLTAANAPHRAAKAPYADAPASRIFPVMGGGQTATRSSAPAEHRREVLRQASVALRGYVVHLWEISPSAEAAVLASSIPDPPAGATKLNLGATLQRWGAPIITGSRWVGCQLDGDGRWCVAPVRSRPASPPPGTERRTRERLILELAGLCLGAIDAVEAGRRRLPPAEGLLEHARQPSVIAHEVGNPLAVAVGNIDLSMITVRAAASNGRPTTCDPFRIALSEALGGSCDST